MRRRAPYAQKFVTSGAADRNGARRAGRVGAVDQPEDRRGVSARASSVIYYGTGAQALPEGRLPAEVRTAVRGRRRSRAADGARSTYKAPCPARHRKRTAARQRITASDQLAPARAGLRGASGRSAARGRQARRRRRRPAPVSAGSRARRRVGRGRRGAAREDHAAAARGAERDAAPARDLGRGRSPGAARSARARRAARSSSRAARSSRRGSAAARRRRESTCRCRATRRGSARAGRHRGRDRSPGRDGRR